MPYKQMYIFLEGPDDERFFGKIIRPIFERTYCYVQSWLYAQRKKEQVKNYLSSVKSIGAGCFFFVDINNSPCITAKREKVEKDYSGCMIAESVVVIVREVEAWYLAGLDSKSCRELGIKSFGRTDNISKEQFNQLIPPKFKSRADFMVEVLKRFNTETAREKNVSFDYFMSKVQRLS